MTIDTSCTMPADAEGVFYQDAWVTTDASCKTLAYVTTGNNVLRRYELTSVSPCTFFRDAAFGLASSGAILVADRRVGP